MAQQQYNVDRTTALYERPTMDILDATAFAAVKDAVASAFAAGNVEKFLKSVERSGLRIRHFEAVLKAGKLGAATEAEYTKLDNGRPRADSRVLSRVAGEGGSGAS